MNVRISFFISILFIFLAIWIGCKTKHDVSNKIPDSISFNFNIRPILSDKCYACHGPDANKRKAELRLDIADSAYAPLKETKGAYAIVPGKPEESELIKRISSNDPSYQMPTPESHLSLLSKEEIMLLTKWIEQGAKYEKHWAFVPPKKGALPKVDHKDWPKNEIDYFTLSKMEMHNLSPSNEASKDLLSKRASLDITGLLPTVEMIDVFTADKSDNAYEKYIDKLLNSNQYGEKMALLWLDISRYSDSYGYQDDNIRTQWPYRDWVIHAFNNNMPYDTFLTWQLAGDMLPNANKEQVLATAFLRNHKYTEEGGVIPEEYRVGYVIDKVKTFSKGILALTVECAQCHDHKYDPISQKDFYQLSAFFNTTKEVGFEGAIDGSKPAKTPILELSQNDRKHVMDFIKSKDTATLMVSVMGEMDTARPTYILNRGEYDKHGAIVTPNALKAVMIFDSTSFTKNRLGLAKWTVSNKNPLTARVFVNQLWQEVFGVGIVKTSGDFGMQGNLPSHPELLDWLAVDFMEHHWDVKYLLKKILMSSTYRQSSKISKKQLETDPDNIYLSHAPRRRVKAEIIRDIVLESSGILNNEIGGPSVKPYQPKGLWEAASSGRGKLAKYEQDHDKELYRRGMYTFIKLTVPPPTLILFDASNRDQCEVKRSNTNTPLQALVMMNDPTVLEASRVLAENLSANGKSETENITESFRRIICRRPNNKEAAILTDYYNQELALFKNRKQDASKRLNVGEYPHNDKADKYKAAALMNVINTVYNMEEAITKS